MSLCRKAHKLQLLIILALLTLQQGCSPKTPPQNSTVHSSFEAKVKSLDPIFSSDKYSSRVVSQIFEGLYHYHYLKRPYTLEPSIAAELPQISNGGKTYRIPLKKRGLFSKSLGFSRRQGPRNYSRRLYLLLETCGRP